MKLQKGEYLVSAFILALAVYPYSAQAGGLTVRIVTPPSQYSHAHRHHGPSATFSVGPVTSFSRTYGPVTSFGNTRFPNRGNRYYYRPDSYRYPGYSNYPSPAYRYKQRVDYLRGYEQGYRDGYRDSRW